MYGVTRPVAARDRAGDKAVMAEAGKRERAASLAAAAGHATVVKDAQQAATRRDRYAIAQRGKLTALCCCCSSCQNEQGFGRKEPTS
jgi:hypothetical protein